MLNYRVRILLLSLTQGLSGSVLSLLIAVSALAGFIVAPTAALATLPVTSTVVGAAMMVYFAPSLMAKAGRRASFMIGSLLGALGGMLSAYALSAGEFPILLFGTFLVGCFTAYNQYYRFVAMDLASTPAQQMNAISIVAAGGIIGGFVGPWAAATFAMAIPAVPFAGAFLALTVLCVVVLFIQLSLPTKNPVEPARLDLVPARSTKQIFLSPRFIVATLNCSVGFAVMTLLMNATPLSMKLCGFEVEDSSTVLQWHFVAMYAPALFAGFLAKQFGRYALVYAGGVLNLLGVIAAIISVEYVSFLISLILFGIGWCLMFNGGTMLLADAYSESEKLKVQGLNTISVFTLNVVASLLAGLLLTFGEIGWQLVNFAAAPMIVGTLIATWALSPRRLDRSGVSQPG